MINFIKTLIILCFIATLYACKSAAPKQITMQNVNQSNGLKLAPVKQNDASELLNFAESFGNASADSQKQMLNATNQKLNINPNDLMQRMQLVMVFGLASSNMQDSAKAQNLLLQILQENILAGSQLAFANVLFDYLVVHNKQMRSLRPDDKKDDKRIELLLQKNEALQLKLDVTQQKLDGLKNIEKSMGEREAQPKDTSPKDASPKK